MGCFPLLGQAVAPLHQMTHGAAMGHEGHIWTRHLPFQKDFENGVARDCAGPGHISFTRSCQLLVVKATRAHETSEKCKTKEEEEKQQDTSAENAFACSSWRVFPRCQRAGSPLSTSTHQHPHPL